MCGIVGIAGDLWSKEEQTMQSLFLLDYFRGKDSTGLAAVGNGGQVKIAKLASDPITLFQMPKFKEALNGNMSKLFLGHNRASTSGSTNNYNAHPYQFDHITGVQNGTLEYKDKEILEKMVGEKFDVDSQALFACVAKFGIKDTIEQLTEGSDAQRGAWSLVWYDQNEDTINFLRNRHRPMWFAWTDDFKKLFFASRWEMIHHAARMAEPTEYKIAQYTFKEGDRKGEVYRFYHLPENQHWKFKLEEIKKGSKERPKPVVKFIKGKEPYKSGSNKGQTWNPFPTVGSTTTSHLGTDKAKIGVSFGKDRDGLGIFHMFPNNSAQPYTFALPVSRFNELIQDYGKGAQGCSWCYKDIDFGDTGITVFDDQDTILCSECSGYEGKEKNAPAAKIYVGHQHFAELKKAA